MSKTKTDETTDAGEKVMTGCKRDRSISKQQQQQKSSKANSQTLSQADNLFLNNVSYLNQVSIGYNSSWFSDAT